MFIKFIQICFLCTVLSYKIRCPERSEIRLYSKKCKYPANYHCILKDDDKTYKEYCRKFEWVTEGNFPIIRGIREHIDYQKCPPERYQPKLVMSNDYYQCQFRKSGCSEDGQVKYNMAETTTNDTKCRCDYTRGYAFVEKPRNMCYCIPSEEDCSCYLNKCHKEQKLDTDYSCIAKLQKYNEKICKPMLPIIDKVADNSTDDWRDNVDASNIYISGSVTQEGKQIVWYIVIITVIVIGICFVGFVVVITVPSMKDKNIDLDIKKHGKTSKEPGNIEVNYSSKEQEKYKDKHLQYMIVGTLSTEAGTVSPKEDKYKTVPFPQVAAVSIETVSYSMHNLRDHSISDTYDKDQRNIPTPETTIHKHDRLVKAPETRIPKHDRLVKAPETRIPKHDRLVKAPETRIPKHDRLVKAPETRIPKHDRLVKAPETTIHKHDRLVKGDADILIIHLDLERTNAITEVLIFKNHLKELVTEMGYNNIRIKLLEEDSKVTVTLEGLFAKYKYIFVYISKNYIPTKISRIGLTEKSFEDAIKLPHPHIKTVCDCDDWLYPAGYPTCLNYFKYKQSIHLEELEELEEYKSKLRALLEAI